MKLETNQAIANGRDLPISTKKSVDICKFIRGKSVDKARMRLQQVLDHKEAVPVKRHQQDVPHKPGPMAGGMYPENAIKKILEIIDLAEKNAQHKGLNTKGLIIHNIRADLASRSMRYGRQGRRKVKRTHIEVIVQEASPAEKATPKKKETKQ